MPLFDPNIQTISAGTTGAPGPIVSFANSNGVTFGISGNTMTASAAGGGGGSVTFSAGTVSSALNSVVFSNSNNVTFGLNGSTITASATVAATAASITVSAGTVSTALGSVVFSNSNNVSFGLNGSTITASATAASTQGSFNISAGTASALLSNVVFSNSNNVSFGLSGSTITATATVASTAASITVSASGSSVALNSVVFSNSNGLSFGLNGSTLTAKMPSISFYQTPHDAVSPNIMNGVSTAGVNMSLQRVTLPLQFAVSRLDMLGSLTVGGSTAGSYTFSAAIYSIGAGTATLLASGQAAYSFNSGTTNTSDQYGGHSGVRWRSCPIATTLPPGADVMVAIMGSVAGVAGTTGSMTLLGESVLVPSNSVGSGNYTDYFADGNYSAGTGVFPATMSITDILQTASNAMRQPWFRLIGSGP